MPVLEWLNVAHYFCSRTYCSNYFLNSVIIYFSDIDRSDKECKFNLFEEESCPMMPPNVTNSDDLWMSCIVEGENQTVITVNGQRVLHACGTGYRYRFGTQMSSEKGVKPGNYFSLI